MRPDPAHPDPAHPDPAHPDGCPVGGERRARQPDDGCPARVHRDDPVVRLGGVAEAKQALRARGETRQAGFTAEFIPARFFKMHPILISDGPQHDEQRRMVARFFTPAVVQKRYGAAIGRAAREVCDRAERRGSLVVDDAALLFTVEVTADIVGFTRSNVPRLARRLERFFRQPPLDRSKSDLGRSRRDWMRAAKNGLGPLVSFYLWDVAPAIRAHRRHPRKDVIGHLLEQGYRHPDILVEGVTYGTAGMVTTREFITMACWHLLRDPALRARYVAAEHPERIGILSELIRLEPPVGHLFRRVTEPFTVTSDGETHELAAGDLIDVAVRDANADPRAYGAEPLRVCADRERDPREPAVGLSFGAGAHACPGKSLALYETDALLHPLAAGRWQIAREPELSWDSLLEGYRLRGLTLRLPPRG